MGKALCKMGVTFSETGKVLSETGVAAMSIEIHNEAEIRWCCARYLIQLVGLCCAFFPFLFKHPEVQKYRTLGAFELIVHAER